MARYILHIGYGKTGTTYLQALLATNREQLKRNGFLYPDIRLRGTWLNVENHNLFGQALAGRLGWHGLQAAECVTQFELQRHEDSRINTVILSGETILGIPQPWEVSSEKEYDECHDWKVRQLAKLLNDHDVIVVVYLRNQVDWLEATINQTVKYEGMLQRRIFRSTSHYVELMAPRLDYLAILERWEHYFGRENIRVGIYGGNTQATRDIGYDFLQRIGYSEPDQLREAPREPQVQNRSWSPMIVEFKRARNLLRRNKFEERVLAESLNVINEEVRERNVNKGQYLDREIRVRIRENYKKTNLEVVNRYLESSEDAKVLISDEIQMEHVKGDFRLAISMPLEIEHRLERFRKSSAGRRLWLRHYASQLLRKRAKWAHALVRHMPIRR